MNKQIIYLIQPAEYINTSIYKIGCSRNSNLMRCHTGYKKGSRYIYIMECERALLLERKIREKFNMIFELVHGREYFKGDEELIKEEFYEIVKKHNKEPHSQQLCNNKIKNIVEYNKKFNIITNNLNKNINKKDIINENQIDLELTNEVIAKLLDHSDKMENININYNLDDKYLNYINELIKTFNIKKLNKELLENINNLSYLFTFKYSSMYFMTNDEINQLINGTTGNELDNIIIYIDKLNMFNTIINFFFKDGLLDKSLIEVNSVKGNIKKEYLDFFNCYIDDIKNIFDFKKKLVIPNTDYGIIKLLKLIIFKLFGNMITLNTKLKRKRIKEKRHDWYKVQIDATKFVELYLCSKKQAIPTDNLIIKNYGNNKCVFKDIHNGIIINDLNKIK